MSKIVFTKAFKTAFSKRIKPDSHKTRLFYKRLAQFEKDRNDSILKDHALKGKMKGYRAFSIDYDLRVIYRKTPKKYLFLTIGTHSEVYN